MKTRYLESIPPNAVPIPGFPGYLATPEGDIISAKGRPKLRRFTLNRSGYPICGMTDVSGKTRWRLVHRIIASLFVPGDTSLTVNHIDMDKLNPRASNLEWVTLAANHKHARAIKGKAWGDKVALAVSKPLVSTNLKTGEKTVHASGKAAAIWAGNPTAAGNISKAVKTGAIAYGCAWEAAP